MVSISPWLLTIELKTKMSSLEPYISKFVKRQTNRENDKDGGRVGITTPVNTREKNSRDFG
ncbi:hypothetical protein RSAG8_13780, partial [Rhizoctonia solani AG-8 WAC10335]